MIINDIIWVIYFFVDFWIVKFCIVYILFCVNGFIELKYVEEFYLIIWNFRFV